MPDSAVAATGRVRICNRKGLHARAAAKLVKTASEYDAQLWVTRLPHDGAPGAGDRAGATSILSLLMLAAEKGVEVEIRGEGAQAEAAVEAILALIARRFDEDE